jgi:CRISPR-associated protein Cas4
MVVVSASLLGAHTWCEYQVYLEKVCGQKRKRTQKMKTGSEHHENLFEDFLEEAEEIEFEEFLEKGGITRELKLFSPHIDFVGVIDELRILPDKIVVIDDKTNPKPYLGVKYQLWSYGLLVKEAIDPNKPVMLAIRDLKTGRVTWKEEFTEEHRQRVLEKIQRVKDVIEGKVDPIPTDKPFKCSYCTFDCDKRLS